MIRRQHIHYRVLIFSGNMHRTKSDTGSRIPPHRLTENIFLRQPRKLFLYQPLVILIGGNINIFQIHNRKNPLHRKLNHRLAVICQRKKLLRQISPAARPEALPSAACHDQSCLFHLKSSYCLFMCLSFVTVQCLHSYDGKSI